MSAMNNETSKGVLTSILGQLAAIDIDGVTDGTIVASPTRTSRLAHLSDAGAHDARSALLTLHFLFPHELLPALDLLDRRLLWRLYCRSSIQDSVATEVFYIQSASAITDESNRRTGNARFRNAWNATKVHYETRLDSWNCTCAAFAQAHLKLLLGDTAEASSDIESRSTSSVIGGDGPILFGGATTLADTFVPVCKHILAATLGLSAPNIFGVGIKSEHVSIEELAAWSAGWGEA